MSAKPPQTDNAPCILQIGNNEALCCKSQAAAHVDGTQRSPDSSNDDLSLRLGTHTQSSILDVFFSSAMRSVDHNAYLA